MNRLDRQTGRINKKNLERVRQSLPFELIFVFLVLVSLAALAGEFLIVEDEDLSSRLAQLNMSIAWIFLADFFLGLYLSANKKSYFKNDWYLLLASIPIDEYLFGSFRVFRLIRIFRIYGISSRPLSVHRLRDKISLKK